MGKLTITKEVDTLYDVDDIIFFIVNSDPIKYIYIGYISQLDFNGETRKVFYHIFGCKLENMESIGKTKSTDKLEYRFVYEDEVLGRFSDDLYQLMKKDCETHKEGIKTIAERNNK